MDHSMINDLTCISIIESGIQWQLMIHSFNTWSNILIHDSKIQTMITRFKLRLNNSVKSGFSDSINYSALDSDSIHGSRIKRIQWWSHDSMMQTRIQLLVIGLADLYFILRGFTLKPWQIHIIKHQRISLFRRLSSNTLAREKNAIFSHSR